MSFTVNTAFVAQFSANVMHLVQQEESRLSGTCREEMFTGDKAFFDQIGTVSLIQKTSRHQDTPHTEIPHTRRMVVAKDYLGNELIDKEDEVRMLIDAKSGYARAFAQGLARLKDLIAITAATDTAYTGQDGTGTETFDTSNNRVAVDYQEDGSTANSNLTVAKVRKVSQMMNENEVPDSDRYAIISSYQLHSLLRDDEFTSRDYNVLQPLASGQLVTIPWMGFNWRRSEQLLYSSGSGASGTRRCLFYHKDGLLIATSRNPVFRIDERTDKNYSTQVHVSVSFGSTRMEQDRVYEVLCLQNV